MTITDAGLRWSITDLSPAEMNALSCLAILAEFNPKDFKPDQKMRNAIIALCTLFDTAAEKTERVGDFESRF